MKLYDSHSRLFPPTWLPKVSFLFWALGLSLGCAAGNAYVQIGKDHSAKFRLIRKELQPTRKIFPSFLQNRPAEETELKITSLDWNAPSIHTFTMEGASFLYYPILINGKPKFCLVFTLDTSSQSPWFQYFQISEVSLGLFAKESNQRDDLARFNNLLDYVVWEIELPGKITDVKDFEPLGPEWWLSNHENRKAILKIPARDILKSRRKYSTYQVCSEAENG